MAISKPGVEQVIDLINTANDLALDTDLVSLGVPTPTSSGAARNTTVTVYPSSQLPGLKEPVAVYYDRIDLSEAFATPLVELPYNPAWVTHHDVMLALNDKFGAYLNYEDIIGSALGYEGDEPFPRAITVQAPSNSYVYRGTLAINLTDPAEEPSEDDDMYYRLIPSSLNRNTDGAGVVEFSFQMDPGCSYDSRIISSQIEDTLIDSLSDFTTLTLVSAKLYSQEFEGGLTAENNARGSSWDIPYQLGQNRTFLRDLRLAETSGVSYMNLEALDGAPIPFLPVNQKFMVHAIFSHPNYNRPVHLVATFGRV